MKRGLMPERLDENDTARYLAIQDTGLLRTMRLHQIERHSMQLTPEQGRELLSSALENASRHRPTDQSSTIVEPLRDPS